MEFEGQKKNLGLALAAECFVPGLGSIYADHVTGAIINWGFQVVGIGMMVWGMNHFVEQDANGDVEPNQTAWSTMLGGMLVATGGRVYGLIDAYRSAKRYNQALAQRLGLPPGLSLGVGQVGTGEAQALGPRLGFRF